jgi:chemotaxis protein CheC
VATESFTELQLDALRELANVGSGNAGTALGAMLGKSIEISVPAASALPLADAVALLGRPDELRHGVLLPIVGDIDAVLLLLFAAEDARRLCGLYGIAPSTPDGRSMLGEVGNILGSTYINVLAQMVGMTLEPSPPQVVEDMLGSILESILVTRGVDADTALVLDSSLTVEDERCSLSFLMLPADGGARRLLERLGM